MALKRNQKKRFKIRMSSVFEIYRFGLHFYFIPFLQDRKNSLPIRMKKTNTINIRLKQIPQKRCGQVLKSLKGLWIQPCSQAGYGIKGIKWDFCISAHPLSFEFKRFYEV